MIAYVVRRLSYSIPIVLGVNLITFVVFFFVNDPDQMARAHLGRKRVGLQQIEHWKRERNYHLPYFFNTGWQREGAAEAAESGWVELPALPRGPSALAVEAPQGATIVLTVQPAGAVVLEGWDAPPSEPPEEIEEGFEAAGSARIPPGRSSHRMNFEVTAEKGAELRLHIALPEQGSATLRIHRKRPLSILERFTQTIFFQKSLKFLWFDFGVSDHDKRPITSELADRIPPSLALTLPMFLLALWIEILVAMFVAYVRGTYVDHAIVVACIAMMSISILFYVIFGQWLFGKTLRLLPVSGYAGGMTAARFVALPVILGVVSGLGVGVRLYRTFFLEEIHKDYVRTARMKGLPERWVLYKHVLKNAMIPILTSAIVSIPFLVMGTLILESFFAIPGMGDYMIQAIQRQDFSIVQAMTFLGSILYIGGVLLTDIAYTFVDPRVRLG